MSAVAVEEIGPLPIHPSLRSVGAATRRAASPLLGVVPSGASTEDERSPGRNTHSRLPYEEYDGNTPAQANTRRLRSTQPDSHLPVDLARSNTRGEDIDSFFAPQHTSTALLPDPQRWVQQYAVALVEALAGRRSPSQLARHSNSDVLARIQRRHRTAVRRGGRGGATGVRRVQICLPCDGVVEAAVVARVNGRPTPIALRLNGVDGRWQVTILEAL